MNPTVGAREPTPAPALAAGSPRPLTDLHDAALLDLDGVVYIGADPVPHAVDALARARGAGLRLAFVTNNASRPAGAIANALAGMGIPADPQQVVTSAQAAARLVAGLVPAGAAVLAIGGPGLREALTERGLCPVSSVDDDPAAVVQGYDPGVGWTHLAEGTHAVNRGLAWVATNIDSTMPTARGIAPGNGTLVEVIGRTTGACPLIAGKPELALHHEATDRVAARRPLVVGDRLDTDIEGALRAGADSLLVLTGVTGARQLLIAAPHRRPRYLAGDLRGLHEVHPVVSRDPDDHGSWSCGGWRAHIVDDVLVLDGNGDAVTGLRVACSALWTYPGRPADVDIGPVTSVLAGRT